MTTIMRNTIALCAVCAFSFVACNAKEPAETDNAQQTPVAAEGLNDEEQSALAAELALEAEERIDENNASAALAEIEAEINADR